MQFFYFLCIFNIWICTMRVLWSARIWQNLCRSRIGVIDEGSRTCSRCFEPLSAASTGCMDSLTWFILKRSLGAYFLLFSLLLSDPKCTVCLVLPHCWSLPTHTSFLVAHASVFLRAYESLSSHILLSWGRPFSKPCATIPEFTEGGAGKGCWILFWCLKWLYKKSCIEAIQYWKIHMHKYR